MGNVSVWVWGGFFVLVLGMLAIDLGVLPTTGARHINARGGSLVGLVDRVGAGV